MIKKKVESREMLKRNGGETLETITPFSFMRQFAENMEHLFEDFGFFRFPTLFAKEVLPFYKEFAPVGWAPKIEVLRHNGELTVRADLPGLTKEDVKVEVTDEALTLFGERKEEKEEKHEGYYRSERNYGKFFREIPLPEGINVDKATATFTNGVLEVTLPVPKIELHGRRLQIK
jgi:HSP20 family protein